MCICDPTSCYIIPNFYGCPFRSIHIGHSCTNHEVGVGISRWILNLFTFGINTIEGVCSPYFLAAHLATCQLENFNAIAVESIRLPVRLVVKHWSICAPLWWLCNCAYCWKNVMGCIMLVSIQLFTSADYNGVNAKQAFNDFAKLKNTCFTADNRERETCLCTYLHVTIEWHVADHKCVCHKNQLVCSVEGWFVTQTSWMLSRQNPVCRHRMICILVKVTNVDRYWSRAQFL